MKICEKGFQAVYLGESSEIVKEIIQKKNYSFKLQNIHPNSSLLLDIHDTILINSTFS